MLATRSARADSYEEFFAPGQTPPAQPPASPSAPGQPAPTSPAAPAAPPPEGDVVATIRAPIPTTAIEVLVRPAYRTWLAGSVAGEAMGAVFSSGAGLDVEAGIRAGGSLLLYAGWSRAAYGVGDKSAYAKMSTSKSFGESYLAGARMLTTTSRSVGALFDIAIGYSKLHQEATDSLGGTASIDFPSVELRGGLGVSVRLSRAFGLEPMAFASFARISSFKSSVAPSGQTETSNDGTVDSPSSRLGLGVGVAGTFDLALSDD